MAEATNSTGEQPDEDTVTAEQTSAEPSLLGMLLKDAALIFAAISLWAAADTWYAVTGLWMAQVIAVGDAILVGLLIASLFHEWGHYAGAVARGAETCRIAPKTLTLFRFKFDYAANDHDQFHWMTYGGHIAHWLILLIVFIALPMDTLGRIALVGAMAGFVAFATFFEYHVLQDTWAGADPEERLSAVTESDFQKAGAVGALVGLFVIAGLA